MSSVPQRRSTADEYLALEREAAARHELRDGQIIEMAGGTARHALVCDNVLVALLVRLRGSRCQPYSAALRVKIQATGNYTYPDLSVVCGEQQFEDHRQDTLVNPRLIVEVLSPSTERHDRGWKFRNYQRIESFEEYVLVSQDESRVERSLRQGELGWLMTQATDRERSVRFESLGCDLPVAEIYEGVVFDTPQE